MWKHFGLSEGDSARLRVLERVAARDRANCQIYPVEGSLRPVRTCRPTRPRPITIADDMCGTPLTLLAPMMKTTCGRRRTPEGPTLERNTMSTEVCSETRRFLEQRLKSGPNRACVDVCQMFVTRRFALKARRRGLSMDSIAEDHRPSYCERRGENATTISSPCMPRAPNSGFCLRGRMPHHSPPAAVSSPICQLSQQYNHSVIYLTSRRVLAEHPVTSVMCLRWKGTCTCRMW